MRTQKILPEACYKFYNLSLSDIEKAYLTNKTIVGLVTEIHESEQKISVKLGSNIFAELPFEETSIYPFTYSTLHPNYSLPFQISFLQGKVICTKVKSMYEGKIILSRKANMLEAFEAIKGETRLPFYVTAAKTRFAFGDVGHGILAKISNYDLCKCRIRSTADVVKVGDSLFVKVINFDELKRANVSYKDTFAPYIPSDYLKGNSIVGQVNEAIDNCFSGFFVNISPQVCGILDYDSSYPIIHYGDVVECIISGASEKGLHLKLSKILYSHS